MSAEHYVRAHYRRGDVPFTCALAVPAETQKEAEEVAFETMLSNGHVEQETEVVFSRINQKGDDTEPTPDTYLEYPIYNELPRPV